MGKNSLRRVRTCLQQNKTWLFFKTGKRCVRIHSDVIFVSKSVDQPCPFNDQKITSIKLIIREITKGDKGQLKVKRKLTLTNRHKCLRFWIPVTISILVYSQWIWKNTIIVSELQSEAIILFERKCVTCNFYKQR